MTAAPAWRQFTFFDVAPVKDVHDLESPPDIFKAALEISCVSSSSIGVLVADTHGSIHLLNKDFEPITSWVAHVQGRVTHMAEQNGILVSIGEEINTRGPVLKIFDLAARDPKPTSAPPSPLLLRSVKLQQQISSLKPFPVSCIALAPNLAHFSIGFADGTVLLYKHLDQSLSSSSSLTALPKVRTIHEPTLPSSSSSASGTVVGSEPVTSLGFKQPTDDSPNVYLFIVTTSHVLSYQVSGKGTGTQAAVVDEIGTGLGCARMDWKARHMVVARDEAIYLCGTDGRGACYAYEGVKSSIHMHRHYIVIISPPITPTAHSASATVRNYVARTANAGESDITKVSIFDLENKYVAYTGTFPHGVRDVVSQWGKVYVLTNDGNLFMFQEKPTQDKLDILYRKSLYLMALSLAKTQGLDEATVADIHKQYGDHLYIKGDYDGAMQQYLHTIGHVQASYVIRKFLDSQRINNLVTYLQELHSMGLANADHTTLLLNTYTKLKDLSRLDSFIKLESTTRPSTTLVSAAPGSHLDAQAELPFDLETAIRVCRQAGYFEHASYLAKKHERHEDYLRIQIEDAGNYKEALQYLRVLGSEVAESNLARYGRALLDNLPAETTQLLVDLCTTTGPLTVLVTDEPESDGPPSAAAVEEKATTSYLSYLALGLSGTTATDTHQPPTSPSTIRATRQESSRDSTYSLTLVPSSRPGTPSTVGPNVSGARTSHARAATTTGTGHSRSATGTGTTPLLQQTHILLPPPQPRRRKISPRLYFALFVDHLEQFIVFLETVAARRWGQTVDEEGVKVVATVVGQQQQVVVVDEEEEVNELIEKADQMAVWNTLLELYLTLPGDDNHPAEPKAHNGVLQEASVVLRKKAINVLKSEVIPYDPTHALILCSGHGYTDGLVLLWERLGMYEDVIRFWMDKARRADVRSTVPDASDLVVEHLKRYGPSQPRLYLLVLRFLTSTPELLTKHQADVKEILEYVDKQGILTPVGIIQVLSRNNVASVGLVKDWLGARIKDAKDEIQNDQDLTKSYRSETATKLRQVRDLSNSEQPRVFHVTRCSACSGQLDLPSIHFMCDHSYHQRCLGEHDTECPSCVREHSLIREIRRNNERLAEHHEVFLQEVKENGFEAVSGAFGRGVLNTARPLGEVV
ncbi:vacuolar membrane protein [Amanita rubescens]|nr:vacuolar membrane protein [Amanita rubescens]